MTWHLKDRELEKKLIAIDPYFSEKLNRNCEMWDSNKDGDLFEFQHFMQRLTYKYKLLGEVVFSGSEIEEVSDYTPKIWNDSRNVTPPEDVIFMAKVYRTSLCEETRVYYKSLIYKDSKWYYVINGKPSCTQMYLYEGDYVEFKSWED
jgi:hypothetical protein